MRDRLAYALFVVVAALLAIGLSLVGIDQHHHWDTGVPWFIASGSAFVVALGVLFIRAPGAPLPAARFSDRDLDFDVRAVASSVYLDCSRTPGADCVATLSFYSL